MCLRPRHERHRRNERPDRDIKQFFDENGAAYPVWQALEAEAGDTYDEIRRNAFRMWTLFAPSFRNQLTAVFGYGTNTAKAITKKAKPKYREIISELPEFEKGDRFKMNLGNCAMIGAFSSLHAGAPGCGAADGVLCKIHDDKADEMVLPQERKKQVYPKRYFRHEGDRHLKAADRNPYSWNMEFNEYPDGSGYEDAHQMRYLCADEKAGAVRFDPALCHLDYT